LNEGSSSRDFQEWWGERFGMIKKDLMFRINGLQNFFRKAAL
jgi:hypothetical protein